MFGLMKYYWAKIRALFYSIYKHPFEYSTIKPLIEYDKNNEKIIIAGFIVDGKKFKAK